MDDSTETLPLHVFDGCDRGNFPTRNARFRTAVCRHLQLQWVSVGGTGNCFFESVVLLLRAVGRCPDTLDALQLRANVCEFFQSCTDSTQDLFERIMVEIEDELRQPLVCSTHAKINGIRVNGYAPSTTAEYLEAVAFDAVWVQGFHWLRAIAYLFEVRVAIVIYGHEVVRFFGQGPITLYLYKVDAETHFDALAPLADGAGECSRSPTLPLCTLTLLTDDASDEQDQVPAVPPRAVSAGECSPPPSLFYAVYTHTATVYTHSLQSKTRFLLALSLPPHPKPRFRLTVPVSVHSL